MGLTKERQKQREIAEALADFYTELNEDCTENDSQKLIWGIKSCDDWSDSPCNLLTMNDFEIVYLKDKKKYIFSVETIYEFKEGYEGETAYLKNILDKFTNWMKENGYHTERKIRIWQFGKVNLNCEFDSIEDVYATFRYMVEGF